MAYTWQYYDVVLLGVAVSLALGTGVGLLTTVPLTLAVTGAGLVAIALIGHGLFVNGPVDEPADLTNEVDRLNEGF